MTDILVKHGEKAWYFIDEIAEMYGINPWTIRMWANRFDILKFRQDDNGHIWFTPEAVKHIGTIRYLAKKKGATLQSIREHLGSSAGNAETDGQREKPEGETTTFFE